MPERPPIRAALWQEIPPRVYRNCRDANHKTIRLFVTGADQAAIARPGRDATSSTSLAKRCTTPDEGSAFGGSLDADEIRGLFRLATCWREWMVTWTREPATI
jgi:hypothetical protein